jgi:hypothetical protein
LREADGGREKQGRKKDQNFHAADYISKLHSLVKERGRLPSRAMREMTTSRVR